ncbi:MAG: heme-binding protein [Lacipirellulaceae bacterium]
MAVQSKRWGLVATCTILGSAAAWAATAEVKRMSPGALVTELLADLPSAAAKLEPHSPVRGLIEGGKLDEARGMLSFQPRDEAPTPKGFPAFTPVGVIEVKQYPAYRKAVGDSFWGCFRHISERSIPMTAPVEMREPGSDNGAGKQWMAFLYSDTTVGELGPIDGVEITDTPAATVASLGVRGDMSRAAAEGAKETLEKWLGGSTEYEAAGGDESPFRLFGYNSPMVPSSERYWEAQVIVVAKNVEDSNSAE